MPRPRFSLNNEQTKDMLKLAAVGFLILAWLLYEYVNYVTTYDSLVSLYGVREWVTFLSVAIVLSDLGAMIRVFTPEEGDDEPQWVKVIFWVWIGVTIMDIFFNWYFLAIQFESNPLVRAPIAVEHIAWYSTIVVAIMIWAVQVGLVYGVSVSLDRYVHGGRRGGKSSRPF